MTKPQERALRTAEYDQSPEAIDLKREYEEATYQISADHLEAIKDQCRDAGTSNDSDLTAYNIAIKKVHDSYRVKKAIRINAQRLVLLDTNKAFKASLNKLAFDYKESRKAEISEYISSIG